MSSATTTKLYSSQSAALVMSPRSVAPLTAEQKTARSNFVNSQMQNDEVAQLRAEQKRIADALRELNIAKKAERDAMQANQPSRLEREIARQEQHPPKWFNAVLASMVTRRMSAGADRDSAIEGVVSMFRSHIETGLAEIAAEQEAKALIPAEVVAPIAPVAANAHKAPKASKNGKSAE